MLAGAAKVEPNEISYRGTAVQRTDLLGGHLQVGLVSVSELPELHGGNKGPLRAIAILSKQRSPALPDVPTAEEQGVPVTMTAERGFAAPKAIPDEIAKKLEAAIAEGPARPRIPQGLARRRPRHLLHARRRMAEAAGRDEQGAAAVRGSDEGAGAEVRAGHIERAFGLGVCTGKEASADSSRRNPARRISRSAQTDTQRGRGRPARAAHADRTHRA